jgi:hypothetical protein
VQGSRRAFASASAVAIAPDGKIVVAGIVDWPTREPDFAVARLTSDLTLDKSFWGPALGPSISTTATIRCMAWSCKICGPAPRGCDSLAANIEIFSPTNTSTCARQPVPGP